MVLTIPFLLLSAALIHSEPVADPSDCHLSTAEARETLATSRRVVERGDLGEWSDLEAGCAVVRVEVTTTGEVANATVVRWNGNGVSVWLDAARTMKFHPSPRRWSSLVAFSVRRSPQ